MLIPLSLFKFSLLSWRRTNKEEVKTFFLLRADEKEKQNTELHFKERLENLCE